jgi:TetR/AcrR family tetracycline transcriptional repressor
MPIEIPAAVRTALALVDADGLDKLTVRRLAAELDVKAPALYWHFSSKRALLDHLADALVAPATAALPPADIPWLDWLEQAATALHRALLSHRDGARIALGADVRVARSLGELAEHAVDVLHRAGCPLGDATRCAGLLSHFVLGRAAEDQTLPDDLEATIETIPFPLMAQGMRERHAEGGTVEDSFRYALGIVLAGFAAKRPPQS